MSEKKMRIFDNNENNENKRLYNCFAIKTIILTILWFLYF